MDNYIFNTFKHLTNNHTMKNLLLFLLLVSMVSFGQTKIGYGKQTSSYDVTVRDNSLAPIGSERKYRVDVETSRVPEPAIYDPSAGLQDVLSTLNAQEKQREAKRQSMDAAAQRMGYSSGREYYFAQRNRKEQAEQLQVTKRNNRKKELYRKEQDRIRQEATRQWKIRQEAKQAVKNNKDE